MHDDVFEDFYTRHSSGVLACAAAILKDLHEAQEVVQEVFLQAWLRFDSYDPSRGTQATWLKTIARSRAIDRLRSGRIMAGHVRSSSAGEPESCDDSLAGVLRAEREAAIRRTLGQLSTGHREVLELAYEEGLSHSRIAATLNQPLGTVKTRIRQALTSLRSESGTVSRPQSDDSGAHPNAPFTIREEAKLQTVPLVEAQRQRRIANRLSSLRVLVLDDDAETLKLTSAVLRRFGAVPMTYSSSASALQDFRCSEVDVMIVDLAMPVEDGYSFLGKVRSLAAEQRDCVPPSAAFTTSDSEVERSRVLIAGFRTYLTKPAHPLALLSAIVSLVGDPETTAASMYRGHVPARTS